MDSQIRSFDSRHEFRTGAIVTQCPAAQKEASDAEPSWRTVMDSGSEEEGVLITLTHQVLCPCAFVPVIVPVHVHVHVHFPVPLVVAVAVAVAVHVRVADVCLCLWIAGIRACPCGYVSAACFSACL